LKKYKPQEYKPGPQYESDAELTKLAGDIGTTIFHPVVTVQMGKFADPKRLSCLIAIFACAASLGLRVVDASVDAHDHQRQYELSHDDDRRESFALDPTRRLELAIQIQELAMAGNKTGVQKRLPLEGVTVLDFSRRAVWAVLHDGAC